MSENDQLDKCIKSMDYVPVHLAAKLFDAMQSKLDAAEKRAGTVSPLGVDRGFACGRHYLSVTGVTVAVEGDPCRDSTLGGSWDKEKIDSVVAKAKAMEAEANTKLDEVTKERDEARKYLDGMDQSSIKSSTEIAQLRDKLAAVEAEAAAMRARLDKWCREAVCPVNENLAPGFVSGAYDGWGRARNQIANFLQITTAGRDLLDEMRRKDERITQLEESMETLKRHWAEDTRDIETIERKCRTAKAALVEARDRVGELESQIRDGVTKAYDAADKALDAKEFAEPEPVWQYRNVGGEPRTCCWRTSDGVNVEYRTRTGWVKSDRYPNWQACVADERTYPCNEHGERIAEPRDFAKAIERKLERDPQLKSEVETAREEIRQEHDAPLAVGDWLVSAVEYPNGASLRIGDTVRVVKVQRDGTFFTTRNGGAVDPILGDGWEFEGEDLQHFRRVPPPTPKPSDADRIAELERQLAEQAPLVEAAREMQKILHRPAPGGGYRIFFTEDELEVLSRIRDAKGGAVCAE